MFLAIPEIIKFNLLSIKLFIFVLFYRHWTDSLSEQDCTPRPYSINCQFCFTDTGLIRFLKKTVPQDHIVLIASFVLQTLDWFAFWKRLYPKTI